MRRESRGWAMRGLLLFGVALGWVAAAPLGLLGSGGVDLGLAGRAHAQVAESRAIPPPPVDFDGGLDTRIREVTLHNLLDFDGDSQPEGSARLSSEAHFFRVRHRIWSQLKLRSGPYIYSRFTTEWRKYLTPYLTPTKTEIILDNLYIDLPSVPYLPLALRLGRQDLVRGEGFILFDGGPNDESRSIYQNAALLTLEGERVGLQKTRIELIAIRNLAWDEFIVANGPTDEQRARGDAKPMLENDETAFGVYLTRESLGEQTVETYYFYKEEEAPEASDPHLQLHTAGTRMSGKLPWSLEFAGEGAYQFGTHKISEDDPGALPAAAAGAEEYDHRSFGGYAWLSRSFLAVLHPTLRVGAIYLSGDDIDDNDEADRTDQGWIPLFSRWPKWSELYLYSLIPEAGRVGNWTNLFALHAGLSLELNRRMTLSYTYYYETAPESLNPTGSGAGLFGSGTERGHNHQWKVTVEMNPSVAWHLLIERMDPGDFYRNPQDDAYFLRWELMLKM